MALLYAIRYTLLGIVLHMRTYGEFMKTEMLSTRIDSDTKIAFTSVCEGMGLSTSQALKLFAKAVVNHGGIPFEVKAKNPNKLTIASIEELESGHAQKAADIKALFNQLDIGNIE